VSWSGCLKSNSQAEALHIKNGYLIRTRTRMQASLVPNKTKVP
jgi:hypothetical protein